MKTRLFSYVIKWTNNENIYLECFYEIYSDIRLRAKTVYNISADDISKKQT